MIRFRPAIRDDVAAVVALMADDVLGQGREGGAIEPYLAAFDRMQDEGANHLIVGEDATGAVVATFQITFISGLSLGGARRAQVESVRVADAVRGQGFGAALMADAETRARAAGCTLIQLTTNSTRTRAHAFYTRLGYAPTHLGFKKPLA